MLVLIKYYFSVGKSTDHFHQNLPVLLVTFVFYFINFNKLYALHSWLKLSRQDLALDSLADFFFFFLSFRIHSMLPQN